MHTVCLSTKRSDVAKLYVTTVGVSSLYIFHFLLGVEKAKISVTEPCVRLMIIEHLQLWLCCLTHVIIKKKVDVGHS